MNIIFWILVVVAMVILWFCLNGAFKAIGYVVSAVVKETADTLNESEDEE